MTVAVLSSHAPSLFWFRLDMMKSFAEAGHRVVAIANEPEAEWNAKFAEYAIRYRQIFVERNGTSPISDLKTLRSITRVLKEEAPEKIFLYQAKTVIYGGIAAKRLRIHGAYPLIAGLGSVFLSTGIKNGMVRVILGLEYRAALRYSERVFFQNHEDSAFFMAKGIVPEEKVVYLNGSGVNTEKFVPAQFPARPTFLFIGRLIRDKGIKEYLDSCRMIKRRRNDVRCLLVGPYDTNPSALTPEELRQYIDDGTVEYFGEQADVRPYMNQCSIFVLPSYHEGTPKTVLEAMASGRAIITTDVSGCRETIQNSKNGILVPAKNTSALAQAMTYLADHPALVESMGVESRTIAMAKFDVSLVNSTIMKTMRM